MTFKAKQVLKYTAYTLATLVVLVAVSATIFLNSRQFGKSPDGSRLQRIKQSPQYKNGAFENAAPTEVMSSDKSLLQSTWEFLFAKVEDLVPRETLPTEKTVLAELPAGEDVLVWLGHSSLFLQLEGKRILVDPVLISASPVSFLNKPFLGSDRYRPMDIPPIDLLLITHDHWDHLDYHTMLELRERIKSVICPLGVGAHLEHWGFNSDIVTEVDWNEQVMIGDKMKLTALPARHFSGRGLKRNQSLWAAYMLQSSYGNIYLSGDTGYDGHFKMIKNKFETIDLAIIENGQYNEDWRYIHLLPKDLIKAVDDLQPKRFMTIHHSKFALGKHAWYEPLDNIARISEEQHLPLLTPKIGEPLRLRDSTQTFTNWWHVD
ncbi:MBL fold metallo-hydrolase [Sphingobacterium griseoflavum]|uniref:MBL fold metallo-hydrolase n=1 Tax=Sphingobacterium griseoflavum TaxID=1474952 RepID=A0ABQ3I031_9SPHI|nr:MBL fold metallo-hydrolase [Sphingobacterium griseoflavum]GHE49251.1 MBL fold metallo-hydrolase [Sphingobacterium griseoflavum]